MPVPGRRDGLHQRGLAAAVLPDEHREPWRRLEPVLGELLDRWDRKRPAVHPHLPAVDLDPAQRRAPQRGHRSNLLKPRRRVTRLLSPPGAAELTLAADG